MKSEISLRLMTALDVPFVDSLRNMAGWNQPNQHWKQSLALAPKGCFVAEWNGAPAGTATTICYGTELGWIGMLLVHPEFRSRGIGRALLSHCIEYLRAGEIRCIKLDATPQGKLLYDQLGFQVEWPLTRWKMAGLRGSSSATNAEIRPLASADMDLIQSLDQKAFGVARTAVLQSLLSDCCDALIHATNGGPAGYGVLREGVHALHLGPLVAATPHSAGLLAPALLASDRSADFPVRSKVHRSHGSGEFCGAPQPGELQRTRKSALRKAIYWDIPDVNTDAVELAKSLGFAPERHWVRMFLGTNTCPGVAQEYFGIADPSMG